MDLIRKLLGEKSGERVERLSLWAFIVSIAHFSMLWLAFIIHRGKAPEDVYPVPWAMVMIYFIILLAYVGVKEPLRWKQKRRYVPKRFGEAFIPLWITSLLVMGWMEWMSEGYFRIPEGMWETAGGAVAIGGLSSISKVLHDCRNGICTEDDEDTRSEPGADCDETEEEPCEEDPSDGEP